MSPKQKKLAAKAPPPNKIDAKDFAVLRAEKAKGRGMGLQDEKVQPGKVMKAKRGKFLRSDPTKPISSVKPLGKLGGAGSMKVSKAHSSVLGKISANKLREMVKTGMNPDLKGDPNIKRGSQKTSMEAKSTLDKVNKKNSSEFLKRRKELGAAGKALSATRPQKQKRENKENTQKLKSLINKRLSAQVRRNMGRPALINQTGIFSNSVELVSLRETKSGLSGEYSYMRTGGGTSKNRGGVYETFESTGKYKWPAGYNPKPLISKSIRDLAMQYTQQKLVSLRRI